MKYEDYVDLKYEPSKTDVVCEYLIYPLTKRAAGAVAAESSIGTWTETFTTKPYVEKLAATVFWMKGNKIKIAYPLELFEEGNLPNFLSSVAGNIFGMKEIKSLKLVDMRLPKKLINSFRGPKFGIEGIRKRMKVKKRPFLGTIIKPKIGLKTKEHVKVAYEAWVGGCDLVKDDENLASQKFNEFEKRLIKTLEAKDKAEEETGERKGYIINVTADLVRMIERAQMVEDYGGKYIMVDVITVGWSALQTLRDQDFNLIIHAHRAGYAAFSRNPFHGISMKVIAKLCRLVGVDQLHVGAGIGKMFEKKEEVEENCKVLKEKFGNLKKVLPIASGGLHPLLVPELIEFFGKDFVIQAGGGIHGHPSGTLVGARAMRLAIEASLKGIKIEEYAKKHEELKECLKIWKK